MLIISPASYQSPAHMKNQDLPILSKSIWRSLLVYVVFQFCFDPLLQITIVVVFLNVYIVITAE